MPDEELQKEVYFPYPEMRKVQADMVSDVYNAINNKKHVIMHAPTGIGKTAAVLAPALALAMKNNLTIFFLTSRQTQHHIVIETLKSIKSKFRIDFGCADIIGKRSMCLQNGVEAMAGSSFHEYCRSLREEGKCEFYINTRKENMQPTFEAKLALEGIEKSGPCHVQEFIERSKTMSLCPYEIAAMAANDAKVIVADYYYIFNKNIRDNFLLKTKKELEKSIIIVDEAHNLPSRIRELLSQSTSTLMIENAKKEARKFNYEETAKNLEIIENALFELAKEVEDESIISKNSFIDLVSKGKRYDNVISELAFVGDDIRDKQKRSFVLSVAKFLEAWNGGDAGFGRILSKSMENKVRITLTYRCLDPSLASKEVIEKSHSTILMSGTLTPTSMYRDILGFKDAIEKEYKSPFPKRNRLNLVIPKTTTRFAERNRQQFSEIAFVCGEVAESVKGNVAMFFPSYELMHNISEHFRRACQIPLFIEKQGMAKEDKENMIGSFKKYKDRGAVLMGISTGSFGEGIDMPGILKAVIIVGLPLQKPDAEAKLLIEYYDDKFGKGFEYGYVLPAITKCLQNAGRCIRSETDKGAIIFLDERYAMSSYYDCFPADWDIEIEPEYSRILKEFVRKNNI